jgi:hypothetical protein
MLGFPIEFDDLTAGTASRSEVDARFSALKTGANALAEAVDDLDAATGTVTSVNTIEPVAGDVTLTAADVGAASTAALTTEATTRGTADTTLQTNIDTVADDLADHEAAAAPHSGHLKADGTVALAANLNLGGFKATNAADGVAATDLATVGQLSIAAAGFAPRPSLRAATTVPLPANTRSTNTLTANANGSLNSTGINGITDLAVGERVGVFGESIGANNGPYEITSLGGAGSPWVLDRVPDFDTSGEAVLGAYYPVAEGTNAGAWYLSTDSATLNTTALVFTQDTRNSGGETNTGSNLGTGVEVFKQKSGVDFQHRTLVAGTGIDFTEGADEITTTVDPSEFNLGDVGGTLAATKGGTGLTAYTLGDTIYSSAANTLAKLSGNATATRKFLRQTGTGAVSAAPAWDTLVAGDLPVMVASGASHAPGAVPDPPASAGVVKFLREDATWAVPGGGSVTNKRITRRVTTEASSATPTINTDNSDVHHITALATNITSFTTNLTGTPTAHQLLHIIIVGTATRTIAWGASFEASTVALPTTTDSTTPLDCLFRWNATSSKWRLLATC